MSSVTLTIDQLDISPFNQRTNRADQQPTSALEKSIIAFGLIHALRAHPMLGSKRFGVHAGGRRYRTIKAAIVAGKLPRDWPIPVMIRENLSEAQLIEESLAENAERRELRDYEVYAGVARAHRKGHSPETIAEALGQDIVWVRQALRLGNLAPPIFAALEQARITDESARAYAATEHHDVQLAAFELINRLPDYERKPARIRAAIKVGDVELDRMLRFVGADVYRAAGGRFELDLFADIAEERGRVDDEALLRELADHALTGLRQATRVSSRRPDLRFVPQPPQSGYGGPDWMLQVTPKASPGDGDDARTIPDGDIVAHIEIAVNGEPEVSYWWTTRAAKHGINRSEATTPAKPSRGAPIGRVPGTTIAAAKSPAAITADRQIKDDDGVSGDTVQIFRSIRRVIMQAMLVQNVRERGDVGIDYLIWSQLRLILTGERVSRVGMGVLDGQSPDPEIARDHIRATEAWRVWSLELYKLQQQPFLTEEDLEAAFLAYRRSDRATKDMAAAVAAALTLERSLNVDGYRLPLHDAVAREMHGHRVQAIRHYWSPTVELFERIPKEQRLAIVEPFVERVSFGPWQRLKSADLTRRVVDALTGGARELRMNAQIAAKSWVHPLLRFTADADGNAADNAQPELEAAE